MNTLKNINEGFFGNIGAASATYKKFISDYLTKLKNDSLAKRFISSYDIDHALAELDKIGDDVLKTGVCDIFGEGVHYNYSLREVFGKYIFISSDTVDQNSTDIPKWLDMTSKIDSGSRGSTNWGRVTVVIKDMQNFTQESFDKIFKSADRVRGVWVENCPKIKSIKKLPKKIGEFGLKFKPSPAITLTYREILKTVPEIEGSIDFYRKENDYESRIMKNAEKNKPIAKKTKIETAAPTPKGEPKVRLKIEKWSGKREEAPTWIVDDRNKVYTADGVEFGRMTRDFTAVYRSAIKALLVQDVNFDAYRIGDLIGYGYTPKGALICKLVRGRL